ncbi:hypothetical protein M23134_07412 [Microscilla marina ATCC 23134]|uniref:Uncharacterized protein n=2 Tax=Microscilla marina TaxID=1027 RepID=A1ZEQ3_MICM2|nr:hypothetical protein M23134_07412 [Microscilla marina ATCC 23134]
MPTLAAAKVPNRTGATSEKYYVILTLFTMSTQANAEHDPQQQTQDLLQSQAVEQIHPEQLLSVSHVFDSQQKKTNQPQTLLSQELDMLSTSKEFLATPIMTDEKEKVLLEELLDRSKGIKKTERKGGYKYGSDDLIIRSKNYADAKFKKAYGLDNFAENLIDKIQGRVGIIFKSIKAGQKNAVGKLTQKYKAAEARTKHHQSVLMATINILNTFIPIGANLFTKALENAIRQKYLGKLANPDLVTNIRLPQWGKNIQSFGATAYRGAIVSTVGQIRGLWKSNKSKWTKNVEKANIKLEELAQYAIHHLMLQMAQEAAQAPPLNLSDPDQLSDVELAIYHAILAQVFPQLAQYGFIGTDKADHAGISSFAEQQFLTETFFYGAKLDSDGEVTHKSYKPQGEVSEYALSALQEMPIKEYKEPDFGKTTGKKPTTAATSVKKDAYQTIETITQGPYDLAYQNMRSTLQNMGLDYNFTPGFHKGLRQSNTLGEKNWKLPIKVTNLNLFRQTMNNSFPDWIGGAPGMVFPRRPDAVVMIGKDIKRITNEAISPTYSKSGKTYLDFSQTNFGDVWVHTNRQDILAAKKGNIKDIRSFNLLFAASGPVFTINDLSHAGHKSYGPKNINGKYQLQVVL